MQTTLPKTTLPESLARRSKIYVAIMTGTLAATGLAMSGCTSADKSENPVAEAKATDAMSKSKEVLASACKPCNPCAAKACNPCAAKACNPCAAKACNPCAAKACNPCAAKACNPCAAKACNPCAAKACNPCAAKACNPCAAKACNPCAAKACNPCAAKACNPCAAKACNPCAAKACNPCAANACNPCNPCGASAIKAADFVRPAGVNFDSNAAAALAQQGKALWNDASLSSNGLSCATCHTGGALLNATFAEPYPHQVAMPMQQAGVNSVDIDEMVNFCMVAPMQAAPLEWNSTELLALSAYSLEVQAGFNPCAAKNPCNPCNPCAAKNPCNPCAAKNPCNPCAAKNPCNPCNPCAAK